MSGAEENEDVEELRARIEALEDDSEKAERRTKELETRIARLEQDLRALTVRLH